MKVGKRLALGIAALVTVASALAASACGRSRPVGSLAVRPASVSLPPSFAAPLELRWTPSAPLRGLKGKPRVFVHVLDGGRRLLRTFDHPLAEPWTPGRSQTYEIELYQSAIAEPLPADAYEITFGLYDDAGRGRWPLTVDGEEVGRQEYRLATLTVPATAPPAPRFEFAGGWLPVEPGSSKQVVARRCLSGAGSIGVVSPPGPGTVRVAASLRAGASPTAAPGAWRISASCSTESAEVLGTELVWVGFGVGAAPGEPPCEIRFTPPPSSEQLLCLEVLAWRPSGG